MSLERKINLDPEQKVREVRGHKEPTTPHPKTLLFFKVAIEEGAYSLLENEEKRLIGMYYFIPGIRLKDLRSFVHPQTAGMVKQTIFNSMEKVWEKLSDRAKQNLPKEEVIKLKHQSYSPEHIARMKRGPGRETRKKLSEAAKRIGFPEGFEEKRLKSIIGKKRSEKTRIKISQGVKAYRETQKIDLNLWRAAIEENLIGPILNQNLLTKEEINEIKRYLEGGEKPPEELMDKFSIAVARTA